MPLHLFRSGGELTCSLVSWKNELQEMRDFKEAQGQISGGPVMQVRI